MIEDKFKKIVKEKAYFEKNKRLVLALSGGLDSMTLLNLLLGIKKDYNLEIILAHVNHGLRQESEQEEEGIKQLAKDLHLPLHIAYFKGEFSEERARSFRYDFFQELMKKENAPLLLTAHHADDQAETIFMKLLRGSKLRYLSGIKEVQKFGRGYLIRPLLTFKKEEFPLIFHFEDQSNVSNDYLRNRIRNSYLPQLKQENPQFTHHLLEMGKEIERLYGILDSVYEDMDINDLLQFKKLNSDLQAYLLEKYLLTFPQLSISKQQFKEILHILNSKANYQGYLKSGYSLIKDYQTWKIAKIRLKPYEKDQASVLEYKNILEKDGFRFSFGSPLEGSIEQIVYVSRETPLVLRRRQTGDRILLRGFHKKISRYFIDKKIPTKLRNEAIIIEQDGNVLGIAGMLTSDLSRQAKHDIMKDKLYIQKVGRNSRC